MKTIKLTDEEYELLKECLKCNLYFYKERIGIQNLKIEEKNKSLVSCGHSKFEKNLLYNQKIFPFQIEQIEKMEELNGKL